MKVSEIGLGCNRIGEKSKSRSDWLKLLYEAADSGVNIFDTSEFYVGGVSEQLLGEAFGRNKNIYIATKVFRPGEGGFDRGQFDLSEKTIRNAVEGSLKRLKKELIDIFQLHSPDFDYIQKFDWQETMIELKEEGKIKHIAVSVRNKMEYMHYAMKQDIVEVVQLTYNIFASGIENTILDLARKKNNGILTNMPLARGVLSGKFKTGERYTENRAMLDKDQFYKNIKNAELLGGLSDEYSGGMTRLALHFCLSRPEISAIIPGANNLEQLRDNCAASNGFGLELDLLEKIIELSEEMD